MDSWSPTHLEVNGQLHVVENVPVREFRAGFPSTALPTPVGRGLRRMSLVDGKVAVELKAIKALTEGDEARFLIRTT